MKARENDDDLVAGVSGLADHSSVIAGLARLHMTDHETSSIPWSGAFWILQKPENRIR